MSKIYVVEREICTSDQYGKFEKNVCAVFDTMEKAIAGKKYYEQKTGRETQCQYWIHIKEFDLNTWK